MAVNSLGEFALIIGDIHIPNRATDIPDKFRDLLLPNKMQYVISPGNVGSREVGTILVINITLIYVLDCRVVREFGGCKEPGTHRERRLWWTSKFTWDQSCSNWKLQDWNDSWAPSYTLGWPRGSCSGTKITWLRYSRFWTHTLKRDHIIRWQILYQPRQCDWSLLCNKQFTKAIFHPYRSIG